MPTNATLYIVSCPIGDYRDITLRALETLRSVSLIAAENISVTQHLLAQYAIETAIVSYRPRAHHDPHAPLLEALRAGNSIALLCDAGTPTLCDPGSSLIRAALAEGFAVVAVPGASALLVALVESGFGNSRFVFEGFPPRTRSDRPLFFHALHDETRAIILYESAAYLPSTLKSLTQTLGSSRKIAVLRDATKPTAEVFRGTLEEALLRFSKQPPRGEYTLALAGKETAILPADL